jgi:hypothetical protein
MSLEHVMRIFPVLLLIGMLVCLEIGYRIGRKEKAYEGTSTVEAAVLGLLGLILAFTFGAVQTRLDTRRELIIKEANAIGTAYLRLDLLPPSEQPGIRDLFRRYLDVRLRFYQMLLDREAAVREFVEFRKLQDEIWDRALVACRREQWTPAAMLVLPAINEMIDVTSARRLMLQTHNPGIVTALLLALAGCGGIVAGYGMSARKSRSLLHIILYAVTVTATVNAVIELDYPRAGLIRLVSADDILMQLRDTIK